PLFRRLQDVLHVLHHDLAENFARLDVLQADICSDRGLHVAVAENLSNELVLTWPALQDDCTGGVPELVHRHAQPGSLYDALRDLATERGIGLGITPLAWKQPFLVPAPQQDRPETVHVFVDQSS